MTPYCNFLADAGVATCSRCGFSMPATGGTIYRHCNKAIGGEPPLSLLEKVRNFAKAAIEHVSAGMPMSSNEEILRRHDICVGCEFFADSSCTKCGCPVKRDRQFISKLAWADQSCPVGKWGPVAQEG